MTTEEVGQKETHAIKSFFALVGSIFLKTFIQTVSAILSILIVGGSSIWIWSWNSEISIEKTIQNDIVSVITQSLTTVITSETFNDNFTQIINTELGTVVKEELSSEHLSEKLKELKEFKELQKLKAEFNELKNLADTGSLGEYLPFIRAIRDNDKKSIPAFDKLQKFKLIDFLELMKSIKERELSVEKNGKIKIPPRLLKLEEKYKLTATDWQIFITTAGN